MPVETYAVDYETTYEKKVRDITTLGTARYLRHPDTHIYMVAIYGRRPDGSILSYSGPVETAPWAEINGKHWVSHNAAFDIAVFLETYRRGQMPCESYPLEWDCTSSLSAFLSAGHSLGPSKRSGAPGAAASLLGRPRSKEVRDQMSGKRWETMTPEFRAEALAYALDDGRDCFDIWDKYSRQWPVQEVFASRHTISMGLRGVATDPAHISRCLDTLKQALWAAEQKIPWVHELDAKGKPYTVGSKKALQLACTAAGIPAPKSTANNNDEYDAWCDQYAPSAPFVQAVKDHRSISRTIDAFTKFRDRTMEDGRMPYGLKYGGAHTLRWSGEGGLNLQNLTKEPLCFDVCHTKVEYEEKKTYPHMTDLRGCIYPQPGKKFIVADLKQIEARVTLWYAEDWNQLALLKGGMDVYEAHARATMGYTDPMKLSEWVKQPGRSPMEAQFRQIAKARVLGLGFGMGHVRLIDYARQSLGLTLSVQQAKQIVNGFRAANPGIVRFWDALATAMRNHAVICCQQQLQDPFVVQLPSWRNLEYFNVGLADGLTAADERGGRLTHWHGGKLAENVVQATARDVLVEAIYRIEQKLPGAVVLHVHDEVVCEVDPDVPVSLIRDCMTVTPDWAPGLPVDSSVDEVDRYFK